MIKNNTIYSKSDYLYMAKLEMRRPGNILFCVVEWVLGLLILQEAIPFLKITFLYHVMLNAEQMWYMIFCLIFGLACIVFPFLMPYIVAAKTYRKSDKVNPAEMTFGEEDIYVKNAKEGVSTEHHFAYSVIDKVIEKKDVVYLRISFDKSKMYLAVHDDSYLEGSREELLTLLKR